MSEANKALCRRFVEDVWNRRNLAAIDSLFAPNYTRHAVSSPDFGSGPESVRMMIEHYLKAFPDTRFTVDDLISEGDKVVLRWTARATHQGEFEGVPPSNRQIAVSGTTTVRVLNGMIAEAWDNFDALGLLQQIGAIEKRAVGRAGG